ncbi:MAG: DNA-3-methyladenine glycosylase [Rhodothermaceae bacterium]|nr:DNA-3-methyladenine glycosylase [Rhodothermaceae bacterium]
MTKNGTYPRLEKTFYLQPDVIEVGRRLLGKVLVSKINGVVTAGMIVETEAYAGIDDRASHAFGSRRTNRTQIMYSSGGVSYIYLCYGIHHLFNVITSREDEPHAVLIRALEPVDGLDVMLERRGLDRVQRNLTGGPGLLTQAMGITTRHNGTDLTGNTIWIEDRHAEVAPSGIICSARVGVHYAGVDAGKPWRFRIRDNPFTSPAA